MRLFFYGTLLDPDVQSLVLGRTLGMDDLIPAILRDFRRVYVAGRLYPMIPPHRGGAVEGAVTTCLTESEKMRVALYEGADYRLERHAVWPLGGDDRSEDQRANASVAAWLYRSRPTTRPSTREWRLSAWQVKEKLVYLRDAQAWLAHEPARP